MGKRSKLEHGTRRKMNAASKKSFGTVLIWASYPINFRKFSNEEFVRTGGLIRQSHQQILRSFR